MKLYDNRPLFRLAFKMASKHYLWLLKTSNEDFVQVLSMSITQVPEAGVELARQIGRNLQQLAKEMGYHRVRENGARLRRRDDQLSHHLDCWDVVEGD